MCGWKWLVLWSLWAARLVRQPGAARRLADGALVRGELAPDGSHELYFGIPYATVTDRFQAPGPAPVWEGVYDAVHEHKRCPQLLGSTVVGVEQCLGVNVYVPARADSAPLPVMLYIHGGGFKEGSSARLLYGADHFMRRDVILVTFNYRLNVLGFLCLGIKEAPGNAGLKDQLAAMKWVKRNIRAFGGDPENITLFGESAGSASVSYHILSPQSKGLFDRAILQSGSSTAPWARQIDPLDTAKALARSLGHGTIEDPHGLYSIFMNTSIIDLVSARVPKEDGQVRIANLPFTPCVELRELGDDAFLTETPYNIYTKGEYNKVPTIVGFNEEEGYFAAALEDDESLKTIRFDKAFPVDLNITKSKRQIIAKQMKTLYMGDAEVTPIEISQFCGDAFFKFPALMETKLLLQTSDKPVYSYLFKYDGLQNWSKVSSGPRFWLAAGASHADELFYLFKIILIPSLFENNMINIMTSLWTDFAKYGEPTRAGSAWHWPAARSGDSLELSAAPRAAPRASHRATHMHFWSLLYHNYRSHK